MAVIELNKNNFETTINKNELVFVDFWAEWCGPCKTFSPIYEAVAKDYPQIVFGQVNIENEPELAADFYVRSVPQLMVFKQGIVIFAEPGSMPATALHDLVKQAQSADLTEVHKKIAEAKEKEGKQS